MTGVRVTECIISPRENVLPSGYVQYAAKVDGRWTKVYAHRVAYQEAHGSIPKGMLVCHTCDNPPCINPEHLFLGTQSDNMQDMTAKGRHHNSKKTHCPQGHEYTEANTYHWRERRYCRTCQGW